MSPGRPSGASSSATSSAAVCPARSSTAWVSVEALEAVYVGVRWGRGGMEDSRQLLDGDAASVVGVGAESVALQQPHPDQ